MIIEKRLMFPIELGVTDAAPALPGVAVFDAGNAVFGQKPH